MLQCYGPLNPNIRFPTSAVNDDVGRDVRGHRSNEVYYRGTIDLPNYIDSEQMEFDVVGQALRVKAPMKGYTSLPQVTTPTLSVSSVRITSTSGGKRLIVTVPRGWKSSNPGQKSRFFYHNLKVRLEFLAPITF